MSFFQYARMTVAAKSKVAEILRDMEYIYPKGTATDDQRDIIGLLAQVNSCLSTIIAKMETQKCLEGNN